MGLFIFIVWIALAIAVGVIGSTRQIGFLIAMLLSVVFSPLVGLIITFDSRKKTIIEYEQTMIEKQNTLIALLTSLNSAETE